MKTSTFGMAPGRFAVALAGFLFVAASFAYAAESPQSAGTEKSKPLQWIHIGGEVTFPQRYVYTDGMTLRAAIKIAKGPTVRASKHIELSRKGEKPLMLDREAIEQGKAKDIELHPSDSIHFVPKE
jgi:hypothetical protein